MLKETMEFVSWLCVMLLLMSLSNPTQPILALSLRRLFLSPIPDRGHMQSDSFYARHKLYCSKFLNFSSKKLESQSVFITV